MSKAGSPPAMDTADAEMLQALQADAFSYFQHEVNPANGLIADKTRADWPASIAATGMALACYPVAVERSWMSREEAVQRTLVTLQFLRNSPQGPAPNATGHKGFYYHFLDMQIGRRAFRSELSTVDTAFLVGGALVAAQYFEQDNAAEAELRRLADELYRRVEWTWALNGGAGLTHGWTPESGFLPYRWEGYDEALLLYVLALGSPTHPVPPENYLAYTATCHWKKVYDYEYVFAGPLFIHQYAHMFLDTRGIQDEYMRRHGIDYFENSRRATLAHREYAVHNPLECEAYGPNYWGLTACDGPGPATLRVNGVVRVFHDYIARGVPFGPDDGTVAPWAAVASLPFAPEVVLPAIRWFNGMQLDKIHPYGYKATCNAIFPDRSESPHCWVSPYHFGINQAPIVLMIENYRTDLIWHLTRQNASIVRGLRRAGFSSGWLEGAGREPA